MTVHDRLSLLLLLLLTACFPYTTVELQGIGLAPNQKLVAPGFVAEPTHTERIIGDTRQNLIIVSGYHVTPDMPIDIQTLVAPYDAETSWRTIAVTRTDSDPAPDLTTSNNTNAPLYAWSVSVRPTFPFPDAWPQGGLLRLRVRDAEEQNLATFAQDESACLNSYSSFQELQEQCAIRSDAPIVLVSPAPGPANFLPGPRYIDQKGAGSPEETALYYATIDAPATAALFNERYGFDGSSETIAGYYNVGDLQVGREIRCKSFLENNQQGVACITNNYGEFGGEIEPALAAAINGAAGQICTGEDCPFAAVAMVYTPPITAPNSVRFMVYAGLGFGLVTSAQLDSHGDNVSIPQNCMNCHGGSSSYDPVTHSGSGARFLPFVPEAFIFSDAPGFSLAEQQEKFRRLNQLVASTTPEAATQEWLDGVYRTAGGINTPGSQIDPGFIPEGWRDSAASEQVYRHVIAPYCYGCHASQIGPAGNGAFDFSSATTFRSLGPTIWSAVCGSPEDPASHRMPNAEASQKRFWDSPARAYLADYLNQSGPCSP